jgi:NAD(P)-dependent dehydrogenase (short-subunit alcohol dehydrogenase family)
VVTPLNEDVFSNEEIRKKMEARTALRRLGTIEDIAGPALAIVSDCFGYMTGTYCCWMAARRSEARAMTFENIIFSVTGGVATLQLNRPRHTTRSTAP